MEQEEVGRHIVDAAVRVHRELGPGLLEAVYEAVLAEELRRMGLLVERQVPVPLVYRDMQFDEGFRLDLRVESQVVVEVKSVERFDNAHRKQLLTYLRLTGITLGYVLNFGEPLMKNGIVRTVNGVQDQ